MWAVIFQSMILLMGDLDKGSEDRKTVWFCRMLPFHWGWSRGFSSFLVILSVGSGVCLSFKPSDSGVVTVPSVTGLPPHLLTPLFGHDLDHILLLVLYPVLLLSSV